MNKGIDISHWQGTVDFKKLKTDFIILKAGGADTLTYKAYKDKKFETYYKAAKEKGIPVGCYWFCNKNMLTEEAGRQEAKWFLSTIEGKQFEYPVYLDIETTPTSKRAAATKAAIAFCEEMEKAGYYVGIYGSDISVFKDRLITADLQAYDHWVARYGTTPKYVKTYGMWQFTSSGHVDGISTNVDMDIAYLDYPAIIKKKHLNGF